MDNAVLLLELLTLQHVLPLQCLQSINIWAHLFQSHFDVKQQVTSVGERQGAGPHRETGLFPSIPCFRLIHYVQHWSLVWLASSEVHLRPRCTGQQRAASWIHPIITSRGCFSYKHSLSEQSQSEDGEQQCREQKVKSTLTHFCSLSVKCFQLSHTHTHTVLL